MLMRQDLSEGTRGMGVKRDVGVATGLTVGALALLTFVFTPPQPLPADDLNGVGVDESLVSNPEFDQPTEITSPGIDTHRNHLAG